MNQNIQIASPISGRTLTIGEAIGSEKHREYTISFHRTDTDEVVGILRSGKKRNTFTFSEHKIGDVVIVHESIDDLRHNSFYASDRPTSPQGPFVPVTCESLGCDSVQLACGVTDRMHIFSPKRYKVHENSIL